MADRRIVLIGYRGTGKTTLSALLQERLGRTGTDTDHLIEEKAGRAIADIFSEYGEQRFREMEEEVIRTLPGDMMIISTGGGAVLNPVNVASLRRDSLMIYLDADPGVIAERISGSGRPSLTGRPPEEEVRSVLADRLSAYRSAADVRVDTSAASPDESVIEIMAYLTHGPGKADARSDLISAVQNTQIPQTEQQILDIIKARNDIILYGILGNPCMHSLSPRIWNRLFHEYRMPAHYTWFEMPDPGVFLERASDAGIRGLSVTIPHKETIIPYLSEVRHDASTIGAVNTVLIQDGKTFGYNTDWKGVYRPLEGAGGEKAVIIGAGGGAAAAAYALDMRGYSTYILNRTVERAENLAARFGAEAGPVSLVESLRPDLIVNTTPIGMGNDSRIPVPLSVLKPGVRVFDFVYTPADTPLLRAALERGCFVIPGTEMFIHQLAEQFKILTGIEVPTNHIREMMS